MNLNTTNISIIKRLLGGRNSRPLKSILSKIEAADLSKLFSMLNDREIRLFIDALMAVDKASVALKELPPPQLSDILHKLDTQKLVTLLSYGAEDDSAYFLTLIEPETERDQILNLIEPVLRLRLTQLLSYPEGSAGRAMSTQVFTLPADQTVQEAIEAVRLRSKEESVYYIYCVDDDGRLIGVLSLRALVTASANTPLEGVMKPNPVTVSANTEAQKVAELVSHYDFVAIPVVDTEKRILGIITVDDVLDIIQEQATADIYATAGLQEDDRVYTRPLDSIRNRLPWMVLNLFLAVTVSSVVALFESTMSSLIILASLNNIVAGIGGNTAIQTLTVVTRGLATGDFNFISYLRAVVKEIKVGITLGVVTGMLAGVVVYFWKGNPVVAGVICVAMILNSLVASGMGALVPIFLKRMNWDPASGSGVLVTFMTDSFGFFSFLGIATLAMKHFG
ncbi:MAG: magnesium transporter [Bdellovibrionales bacterium]|nr:magnesium transporter [Bdellovibrionales bacterium]